MGAEALSGASDIRVNPAIICSDIGDFGAAIGKRELERAAELYAGHFLNGVHIRGAPEFEQWVETTRNRFREQYRDALEGLAKGADTKGAHGQAVVWWRRLVVDDPLSSRAAAGLITSLALAGNSAAGLAHYRLYEKLLHAELEMTPDPVVADAVHRIQNGALQPRAREPLPSSESVTESRQDIRQDIVLSSQSTLSPPNKEAAARQIGPRSASRLLLAGVSIAAALLLIVALARPEARRVPDSRLIVVVPFDNRTGNDSLASLGIMASDLITDGLARSGIVNVVDPGTVLRAIKDASRDGNAAPPSVERVARETNASVILVGNYAQFGDSLHFHARIIDARSHEVLTAIPLVAVAATSSMKGIELVRERVLAAVAKEFDENLSNFLDSLGPTPSYEAYRDFTTGMEEFTAGSLEDATKRFDAAYNRDTTFMTALLWSVWGYRHEQRHGRALEALDKLAERRDRLTPLNRHALDAFRANYSGDVPGSILAAHNAGSLAPLSEWAWNEAFWTLQTNRPEKALLLLSRLDPNKGFLKGWRHNYWLQLARAAHAGGDYEAERRTLQRALDDGFGNMLPIRVTLARNLAARGKTREAIQEVDRVLAFPGDEPSVAAAVLMRDFRIHGLNALGDSILERVRGRHRANRRVGLDEGALPYGGMLYVAGRFAEAERVFEEVVRRSPTDATALGHLAVLHAQRGDTIAAFKLAARIPKALLGQTFVYGREHYWRARVAAALQRKPEAVAQLRRAFSVGYPRLPNAHTHRFDFPSLWGYAPFEALVRPQP